MRLYGPAGVRTAGTLFALALIVAAVRPLEAGQAPTEFARGFTAQPEGNAPLWEVALREEVYTTVTRADLADLRVFNSDGVPVPHVVRRAPAPRGERLEPRRLPVFPLRGPEDGLETSPRVRILTDSRGRIVAAVTDGVPAGGAQPVLGYLIDLRMLPQKPETLELEWERRAGRTFAATVSVDASDDLVRWHRVVSGVAVADLSTSGAAPGRNTSGAALLHRAITLPVLEAAYLRVDWPASIRGVRLTAARAFFPPREPPVARHTREVAGRRTDDSGHVYEFDTRGVRPVDRLRLVLHDRNSLVETVLLSRATPEGAWRRRFSGTIYHLERDGTALQSGAAAVERSTDRYWRAELSAAAQAAPRLELGWVPDRLTVVAQGRAPFTVAFGSARVEAAGTESSALLRLMSEQGESGLVGTARTSEVITLGGEARRLPPRPLKTWALWGVLVSGVAMLAWMVRQQVVRMRES